MVKVRKNLHLEENIIKKAEIQAVIDGITLPKIIELSLEAYLSKATFEFNSGKVSFGTVTQQVQFQK